MMAGKQNPRIEKADIRKREYENHWKYPLLQAPLNAPATCALAVCCPCCMAYFQRKRALHHDLSRSICCNGDWPCSGRLGEERCPAFCLALEVIFCFPQSVASTRWLLQDEMHVRNTPCDNVGDITILATNL